jgi:hypothetical protein
MPSKRESSGFGFSIIPFGPIFDLFWIILSHTCLGGHYNLWAMLCRFHPLNDYYQPLVLMFLN